MSTALPRRSVLAALGLGLGAVLAGCDANSTLSDSTATPGPNAPSDPSALSSQAADEEALLLALERGRGLSAQCRSITGATGRRHDAQRQVQAALDQQVEILENVLRAGQVAVPAPRTTAPGDVATSSAGASTPPVDNAASTDDTSSSTVPPGDAATSTSDAAARTSGPSEADLAAAALRSLGKECLADVTPEALGQLSHVSAANLPMLLSIAGQRGASAQLFGREPQWEDLAGPTDAAANALLVAYRPAVYGFEVLAARSSGDERTAYEEVLATLRSATRQVTQLAGKTAAPAPLGYGLPRGTETASTRGQLAGELMAALPPTIMGQTKAFTGDPDAVAGSVRLLADAVHLAQPWTPITGFPGMRVPGA